MEAANEQLLALKRAYRDIVGEAESALQFFLTAEQLQSYLHSRAGVEPGYARRLLQTFTQAQKSVIDFDGFAEMVREIWSRFLPALPGLQAADEGLLGEQWANAALVDAALLVWARASSPALHVYLRTNTLHNALETLFNDEQQNEGCLQFDALCDAAESKLSAAASPFGDGSEAGAVFADCVQSALVPLAVAKEPSCVHRAAVLAFRLFERFLELDVVSTAPALLLQRDANFFRSLAIVVSLFRFPGNFEGYAAALQRVGTSKEMLHRLLDAVGNVACAHFEAGVAQPGDDALFFLLAAAE